MVLLDCAGQLHFTALVVVVLYGLDAGDGQGSRVVDRLISSGHEEPQGVLEDGAAKGALENILQVVGMWRSGPAARSGHGRVARFERRLGRPRRILKVDATGAGEGVASAFRHGVDDSAAEPSVLGRDACGQDLSLLDRILDKQVLGRREQVVVHVDAIDHEDVVERERSVDHDLTDVR